MSTLRTSRALVALNILASMAVLWFGIQVSLTNRQLQVENSLLKSTAQKPYVIRNLEPTLLPYLRALDSGTGTASTGRRMILFGRDGCKFCRVQFPYWQKLVAAAAERRVVSEVWLVSMNEGRELEQFAHIIAPLGLPVHRFSVTTVTGFDLGTGINGVPTTVVTNDGRVELVHTGTFTEELLQEALRRLATPNLATIFLPRRSSNHL